MMTNSVSADAESADGESNRSRGHGESSLLVVRLWISAEVYAS